MGAYFLPVEQRQIALFIVLSEVCSCFFSVYSPGERFFVGKVDTVNFSLN